MSILPHTLRKAGLVAQALRSEDVGLVRKILLLATSAAMFLPELGFDIADFLTGVGIPVDVVAVIAEYVCDGFALSLVLFLLLPKELRQSWGRSRNDAIER